MSVTPQRIGIAFLALLCFGVGWSIIVFADHGGQVENADGSFSLAVGGEVEAELIFSKGAFRNLAVVLEPTMGTWNGLPSCTVGGETIANCFFDTAQCIQECHINQAQPAPGPNEDINCGCLLNTRKLLGTFPAGTTFRTKLFVDDRSNGDGIDFRWSSDLTENNPLDGFDHLRTFHISPSGAGGFWRLEWEDLPGGGDQDFNDVVLMLRVQPANLPPGSVLIPDNGIRCSPGAPPGSTAPPAYYVTNVTVDPVGIPDRRLTLTQVVFNTDSTALALAVCPMLNFDKRKDNGSFVPRASLPHKPFSYSAGNGIPDCSGAFNHPPSVRFSVEFDPFPPCITDAYTPTTPTGDIVTVPPAVGGSPGVIGLFSEVRLSDIDALITNPTDQLSGKSAADIKAELEASSDGLYTDILFNFQPGITNLICPNGVNTYFDALPSCSVAHASYVWNPVSTVSVASPVTVPLPLHSTEGHTFASPQSVILDIFWSDNLTTPLAGHITSNPPARVPFIMTPQDGRNLVGELELDFPDDLPNGFLGSAYVVLSHTGGGVIVVNAINFAKDATPPAVLAASTARSANHEVTALVEASDPTAGLGDLTLLSTSDSSPGVRRLMRWQSGDFRNPTEFSGAVGPFNEDAEVELSLRVNDEFRNSLELNLPVAHAGADQAVECTSPAGAEITLNGSKSTTPPEAPPTTFAWTDTFGSLEGQIVEALLSLGQHDIGLQLEDARGFTGTDAVRVNVVDTTPPTIESLTASPDILWPPNHKIVPVTVTASVSDICDAAPTCRIISVSSNEPAIGPGAGNTAPDLDVTGDFTVNLRAEHSGKGSGRIYIVTVRCTDATGNSSTRTVTIMVPHDQRKVNKKK